ncbi:MAG: HAMP domain-containing protein, partial [bacterium]
MSKSVGLRTKLIGGLLLIITAVMLIITYINIQNQIRNRINELTEEAKSLARVFGLNYAKPLLTGTKLDSEDRVSTRLWRESSSKVVFLKAYSVNGKIIHQTPEKIPNYLGDVPRIQVREIRRVLQSDRSYLSRWDREKNLYDVLVPIRYHGTNFGVVRLGIDTLDVKQTRMNIIVQNLQITALFWAGAALLGLIFTIRLVRPIENLVETAQQLGGGDLDARSEVHTGDEIEELGDHFNDMAKQIQKRVQQQKKSLDQLESIQRVGTMLNETGDPDVFFPVLDEAMQTLYDIEQFIPLIQEGEIYKTPYTRPEMDSPLYLPKDSSVIEQMNREPEPFQVEPGEDWPEELRDVNWAYPLKVSYYLNGVLLMKLGREPSERELSWMKIWGTQVSQAVRSIVLNDKMNTYRKQPHELIEDELTRLFNEDNDTFGRITIDNFYGDLSEKGLFYGDDFYEQ